MGLVNRQVKGWYVCCGLACLALLSGPFLWRTHATILAMCGLPCGALLGLVGLVIWLPRAKVGYKPIVAGILAVAVSFGLSLSGDSVARELIFRWNYRSYRVFAAKVVREPTPKIGRHRYSPGKFEGLGVYAGEIEVFKDRYEVRINTCAGPTVETVAFSPTPISEAKYTFKHRDKLGYWYFVSHK